MPCVALNTEFGIKTVTSKFKKTNFDWIYKLGPNPTEYALTTAIIHTRMIQFTTVPWTLGEDARGVSGGPCLTLWSTTSSSGVLFLRSLWLSTEAVSKADQLQTVKLGRSVLLTLKSSELHGLLAFTNECPLRSPMVIRPSAITEHPLMSRGLLPTLSENTMEVRVAITLTNPKPTDASTAEALLWNPTEWKMVEA